MGDYIAFSYFTPAAEPPSVMLEGLWTLASLQPAAIGARGDHHRYLLSGYALEDFAESYLASWRKPIRPRAIEIAATESGPERSYLLDLSARMSKLESTAKAVSPFEAVDDQARVTYLRSPPLAIDALRALDAWAATTPRSEIDFYAGFAASLSEPGPRPWTHAFRGLFDRPPGSKLKAFAYPLLFVASGTRDEKLRRRDVCLYSQAQLWAPGGGVGLGSRVSPADADANLARFVEVARTLLDASPPIDAPLLRTKGSIYRRDPARLAAAFSTCPGLQIEST
jgi:hypothetical protein